MTTPGLPLAADLSAPAAGADIVHAWRGTRWSGVPWFAAFWLGYPAVMSMLIVLTGALTVPLGELLRWKAWHAALGAGCAGLLWWGAARLGLPSRRPGRDALLLLAGIAAGALAWVLLGELTVSLRAPERLPDARAARAHNLVTFGAVLGTWAAGWWGFATLRRLLVVDRQLAAARAAASEARLQHLNAQLDPHFLFNTLATVRALVPDEPQAARELVADLADHLRATLRDPMPAWCTLDEELARLESLVAIHRHRLPGGSRLVRDVPSPLGQREIPSLLLQPLVENALDHGAPDADGLVVRVRAAVREDALVIEVGNAGTASGARAPGHHGLGLSNVRRRLAELYGDRARLTLEDGDGRVTARVTLPLARLAG